MAKIITPKDLEQELASFIVDVQKGHNVERHLDRKHLQARLTEGHLYIVHFQEPADYQIQASYERNKNETKILTATAHVEKPEIYIIRPFSVRKRLPPIFKFFYQAEEISMPGLRTSELGTRHSYEEALHLLTTNPEAVIQPGILERAIELKRIRDTLPKNGSTPCLTEK